MWRPCVTVNSPAPTWSRLTAPDEQEFALVRKAIELGLPILSICRGIKLSMPF